MATSDECLFLVTGCRPRRLPLGNNGADSIFSLQRAATSSRPSRTALLVTGRSRSHLVSFLRCYRSSLFIFVLNDRQLPQGRSLQIVTSLVES